LLVTSRANTGDPPHRDPKPAGTGGSPCSSALLAPSDFTLEDQQRVEQPYP